MPLINWSEARHCALQEGSAIRPVGRVINAELQRANHMLVPPSPGPEAPCRLSVFTSHIRPASRELSGQKKHTEKV